MKCTKIFLAASSAIVMAIPMFGLPLSQAYAAVVYSGQVNANVFGTSAGQPVVIEKFNSPSATQATATQNYSSDLAQAKSTSTAGGAAGGIFASSTSTSKTPDPAALATYTGPVTIDSANSAGQSYVDFQDSFVVDVGALNGTSGTINFSVLVRNDSYASQVAGPRWDGSYQWAGFSQFSSYLGSTGWSGSETYSDNYHRRTQGVDAYHTGGQAGTALGSLTDYEAGLHNFSLNVVFGQAVNVHMQLQTWSSTYAQTEKSLNNFALSEADYKADLGLQWGGISMVSDLTGKEIGSFTAIGASGFNYEATPITSAMPEPESYALMLTGLALMGFVARRKKNKPTRSKLF
jgi:hypothetical protein